MIDRRVDLQEVVIGPGADVAPARRDDAGRHRAAEAERVADRDHPIADARRLGGEVDDRGSLSPWAFSSARSVLLSMPITLAGIDLPSDGGDGHFGRVVDDVVVGDDVAVGRDEEAGPLRLAEMMARRAVAVAVVVVIGMPKRRKK